MGNANINALYAGSLRIKISFFFFLSNATFYMWCVTKVAHCIGCTRSAVVLEEDWRQRIQTMFVQDAVIRLDQLTIDLSHR